MGSWHSCTHACSTQELFFFFFSKGLGHWNHLPETKERGTSLLSLSVSGPGFEPTTSRTRDQRLDHNLAFIYVRQFAVSLHGDDQLTYHQYLKYVNYAITELLRHQYMWVKTNVWSNIMTHTECDIVTAFETPEYWMSIVWHFVRPCIWQVRESVLLLCECTCQGEAHAALCVHCGPSVCPPVSFS